MLTLVLASTLAACNQLVPQTPAELVRRADAKACMHADVLDQVEHVATFADVRPIPADEAAALNFQIKDGAMLSAEAGVGVTCEVSLEASHEDMTFEEPFVFQVVPLAGSGDVTIRWNDRAGNYPTVAYSNAKYEWQKAKQASRPAVEPVSYTPPQEARPSPPQDPTTAYLLREFRSVCDGTNPRGGIDRIRDQTENREARRLFGWTAFKLFVGLWRSEERPVTEADMNCAAEIRDALQEQGLLEGMEEDIQRSIDHAGSGSV